MRSFVGLLLGCRAVSAESRQLASPLGGLDAKVLIGRRATVGLALVEVLELRLLGVQVELAEAALGAADPVARLLLLDAHDADADVGDHAVVVKELGRDAVRVVLGRLDNAIAGVDELAKDAGRLTKEGIYLIDQVRAQVIYGTAALAHLGRALPVGGLLDLVSIKVCLKLDNATEGTLLDQLGCSSEIGIPTAVLVDTENTLLLSCQSDQLLCFSRGRHKRLLAKDMLAGIESLAGHLKVCRRGGCENDEIQL